MNYFLLLVFAIGIFVGVMDGLSTMSKVRKNPDMGVKPSSNIFTFFLLDNYK
jgi:hypothetical protein